jgi:hypothetical protein
MEVASCSNWAVATCARHDLSQAAQEVRYAATRMVGSGAAGEGLVTNK